MPPWGREVQDLSSDRPPRGSLLPFGPGSSFQPQYPTHYRPAFAFSAFLYPLQYRQTLRSV